MLQCKKEINIFWETLAVSVDSRSESKKQNVLLKYTNCILTSAVLAGCTVWPFSAAVVLKRCYGWQHIYLKCMMNVKYLLDFGRGGGCFLSASARPPTSGCDRAWQFLMHLGEVHMYLHWRPHKSCLKENKYKNVMFKNWKVILNYIQCLKRKSQKYCVSVKLCHCCTLSNTDKDSSGHNKECNCYRL